MGHASSDGWIIRSRLTEQLDRATGPVVVRGEPGAGKTTLISQWVQQLPASEAVGWVSFDTHDRNDAVAWRKLLLGLRSAAPDQFGCVFEDFTNGVLAVADLFSIVASASLRLVSPLTVVLDDLHCVSKNFQSQLCSIYGVARQVRFLCTSREQTAFELDDASIAGGLLVIDSRDLELNSSEIRLLLGESSGPRTTALVTQLRRAAQGHLLATRLVISKLQSQPDCGGRAGIPSSVVSEVLETTLDSRPEFESVVEERFALACAMCPQVTTALADRLSDHPIQGWAMIESFEARGLGRVHQQGGIASFQFHSLVKAALVKSASHAFTAEETARIQYAAFDSLEGIADPVDLFTIVMEAKLEQQLFPFFARNYSELSWVRAPECIALLESLPVSCVEDSWALCLIWSILLVESKATVPDAARKLARRALTLLKTEHSAIGSDTYITVKLARFAAHRAMHEYAPASRFASQLLRELQITHPGDQLSEQDGWAPVLVQCMVTHHLNGELKQALAVAELLAATQHHGRRRHVDSHMSFVYAVTGDLRRSERLLARIAETRAPSDWPQTLASIGWHLASALSEANQGRAREALNTLEHTLPPLTHLEIWPGVLWTRARLHLAAGDAAYGLLEFEAALTETQHFEVSSWWRDRLTVCHADLSLAAGKPAFARRLLTEAVVGPDADLTRTSLDLAGGNFAGAADRALELVRTPTTPPRESIAANLLLATAELQNGNPAVATERATAGMQQAKLAGNWLPLKILPRSQVAEIGALVPSQLWRDPVASPFKYSVTGPGLTKREISILQRLATRGTVDEIAAESFVSPNTMKTHIRGLYRKLGVRTRADAVSAAIGRGLTVIEPERHG